MEKILTGSFCLLIAISCLKFLVMGFGSRVLSFIALILFLMFGRKCDLSDSEPAKNDNYDDVEDEDEECDVTVLRRMVKAQRREVERERLAAASAAQEALAMILTLQTEKSRAELASVQFRRVMEEKLRYSDDVMEDLRRVVADQEDEIRDLQDQLNLASRL